MDGEGDGGPGGARGVSEVGASDRMIGGDGQSVVRGGKWEPAE